MPLRPALEGGGVHEPEVARQHVRPLVVHQMGDGPVLPQRHHGLAGIAVERLVVAPADRRVVDQAAEGVPAAMAGDGATAVAVDDPPIHGSFPVAAAGGHGALDPRHGEADGFGRRVDGLHGWYSSNGAAVSAGRHAAMSIRSPQGSRFQSDG